jgi:hypothetical protein
MATAPAAAEAAPQATFVEPLTGQAIQDAGLGGAPPPGASPPAPRLPATQASEAAMVTGTRALATTLQPTLTPTTMTQVTPAPTQIARAPQPQPPAVPPREGAYPAQPPAVNPLRIAEGVLAVLALALGVAAWIARRRSR